MELQLKHRLPKTRNIMMHSTKSNIATAETIINEGGIAGTGHGTLGTGSEDFRHLQAQIMRQASLRSHIEKLEDRLLSVRFRMEDYLAESHPAEVLLPGTLLRECIDLLGVKRKVFAAYVGMEESNLSDLLRGRRKISPEFALKLGDIFNIPPRHWLDVQNKIELLKLEADHAAKHPRLALVELLAKGGITD